MHSAGKEILVPLTSSLYVPGTIADTNEVLVDVGTGYFVGKSVPAAEEFIERKVRAIFCEPRGHLPPEPPRARCAAAA